ncbi:MAG: RNA methyltransferase [Firmicutes bacterium]|nr:RNA methyltransferase [Bacillota bacterium]
MNYITSTTNQKIIHAKKLGRDKKYRSEKGEFLVEGIRWVNETIKWARDKIESIFILEESVVDVEFTDNCKCEISDKIYFLSQSLLKKIATTETPQPAVAIVKMKQKEFEFKNRILFLDEISDPGNVGTIIRTGVASGFSNIILKNCVDIYNPKVVRSTMGTLLHANILEIDNANILTELKSNGYSIVAADIKGENVFESKNLFQKAALVIGSEAHGLSSEVKNIATHLIKIPMDKKVESLNASVSAGIMMYQLGDKVNGGT